MRLFVLSDLHLCDEICTGGTALKGDCLYAISQLKALVREYRPDGVVIAGDIFNQPLVSSEELKLFRKFCEALDTNGEIFKLAVQGNHDMGSASIPAVCFAYHDLDAEPMTIEGITFAGVKYSADLSRMKSRIADSALCDILVTHASTVPFANFTKEVKLCPDDFPDDVFTIVGDTHVTQLYERGGKRILSPGYFSPSRKNEFLTGTPGGCILEIRRRGAGKPEIEVYEMSLKQRFAADATELWPTPGLLRTMQEHENDALPALVYCSKEDAGEITRDLPYVVPVRAARHKKDDGTVRVSIDDLSSSLIDRLTRSAGAFLKADRNRETIVPMLSDLWNAPDAEDYLMNWMEGGERIVHAETD